MRRPLARLRAWWGGYFWLPCKKCGRPFGGHEVTPAHSLKTSQWGGYATCPHPDCVRETRICNEAFDAREASAKASMKELIS